MLRFILAVALALAACGTNPDPPPVAFFPPDFASTYTMVRDCRRSADHDLNYIRVYANALAAGPYTNRDAPFPEGAILVKEELDFADATCSGAPVAFTASQRLSPGSSSQTLDWHWMRTDSARTVLSENSPRCVGCHEGCVPPDGYEYTCAVP